MKFSQYKFTPEVKRSIEELGFNRPTDIQFKSIPPILNGEDVLAIAQTGTGKTAAFAIPVIDKLHARKSSSRSTGIRCLVMVPTRELAQQIGEVFQSLTRHTKVKTMALYGGTEQDAQVARLEKGIDVIISTPGRMFDLEAQGHVDLSNLEVLILDEADHMLDLGFIHDIRQLVTKLPRRRQTLFFSATIDEKIKKLAYSMVRNAIRIQISPKNPVSKNVDHSVLYVDMDDKRFFLERLVNEHEDKKILVFVRTKVRAERVEKAMARVNIKTVVIHGGKDQAERNKVMDLFRTGDVKVLIATDVSARGIDIPGVELVVNYDLPDVSENYVHRVGRTGRGNNKGLAVSFSSKDEADVLKEIEEYLGDPIQRIQMSKGDYSSTIDLSSSDTTSWQELMKEGEKMEAFTKEFESKKAGRKAKRKTNKAKNKSNLKKK